MTKEILAQYRHINQDIEETKKQILRLEKHPPSKQYDKVYGSDANFPYTVRSFKIEGMSGHEEDVWHTRMRKLEKKLYGYLDQQRELHLEILEFVQSITDISTKLMFTYYYIDSMEQEEIARKLHVEQSTISKRIKSYLERTYA